MKNNKLVLFFTDKMYRKATLEWMKIKFTTLPGIRHIISLRFQYRFFKKTQHMDSWEQHVELKNFEHQTEEFIFTSRLIRLYLSIIAEGDLRNDEDFLKCKQEVLECKMIEQANLQEFREWVEGITPDETDGTRVKVVFDKIHLQSLGTAN